VKQWGSAVLAVGRLGKQVAAHGARFHAGGRETRTRVIVTVTAIVAILAGFGIYQLTSGGSTPPNAPVSSGAVTLPGPFRVMSITPAPGSSAADGSLPVTVTFSAPLSRNSPMPSLVPDVAGSWRAVGDSAVFTPAMPFRPSTKVTVTIPGGMSSTAGHQLSGPKVAAYTTGSYSTLRLAELLGQLGYLPASYQLPDLGMRIASQFESSSTGLAAQEALAYSPPEGTFSWAQGYPASLQAMWTPNSYNVILKGAVMAFQSEHNMTTNGSVTAALWRDLFKAAAAGQNNANGYTYAVADQTDPETLTIYHDGQVVMQSPANTGIPSAPTVNGTFPVYEKFLSTIMSGTNPGGSHYSDLVQYVSYFNGGDAVHYFARGGYGYQQSLGCVELPFDAAKQAYPFLTLGSLVTVTG
jgi:lipoprotein-anchoring transpeptidase ErfK/SrfK